MRGARRRVANDQAATGGAVPWSSLSKGGCLGGGRAGLLTRGSFSGGAFPGIAQWLLRPPSSPLTVAGPCRIRTDFPGLEARPFPLPPRDRRGGRTLAEGGPSGQRGV